MRRWLEAPGGAWLLWGGGGTSEGSGGAGGGIWAGSRGGAGGGAGGSSLSPDPFSTTREASAGSSNNTEPCMWKEDTIILLSNYVKLNQEARVVSIFSHIVAITWLIVN